MIRSDCRFSDSRVALSCMMLDTMSCPCIGWTFLLSDRSSSVHTTQRICSPRAVWLVHLLDSVLRLMLAVGALFVAGFVCKFACAFRVCSAGVARVYFGFGCDHSAPATMIKRRISPLERECD